MRSGDSRRGTARWSAAACLAAAALALTLSACGGGSAGATARAAKRAPGEAGSDAPSAGAGGGGSSTQAKAPSRAKPGSADCAGQIGDFLDSMARLRANLVAGLSYEQYVGEVEAIRGTYREVPVDQMTLGCLKAAGTPGESGLNGYIAASDAWTACVEESGCEAASIEAALRNRWQQASKLLSEAQAGLKRLEKHPT
jgi:hypothetical protein